VYLLWVSGFGCHILRSGIPRSFIILYKMSSTLFGRGTHTQVGSAHRAEIVNRELAEIRALLEEVRAVPALVQELRAAVLEMKGRLDAMNVPQLTPAVTQEQFAELETRVEALKVLQAPQVTMASLQALERRIEGKIAFICKDK